MTIISIKNTSIAADKIAAITVVTENGLTSVIIDVGGNEQLNFRDTDDGSIYANVMKQWREYLANKQSYLMEAVQYGIILASERGALSA